MISATCSTTGALEAAYAQAFGKNISLSEQQLVDCAGPFNNFGCNGGLPSQAFEYIKYNGGLDTEEAYPYTGKDGVCKFSAENVAVKVLDSVNITLVLISLTSSSKWVHNLKSQFKINLSWSHTSMAFTWDFLIFFLSFVLSTGCWGWIKTCSCICSAS